MLTLPGMKKAKQHVALLDANAGLSGVIAKSAITPTRPAISLDPAITPF